MIIFIIWLLFLLLSINECYKGNYLYIILFVVANISYIYIIITKSKTNPHKEEQKEVSSKNNNITDEDIQDLIFFDKTNEK